MKLHFYIYFNNLLTNIYLDIYFYYIIFKFELDFSFCQQKYF